MKEQELIKPVRKITKNEEQFLESYRQLCVKHKLQLGGCGCCGSPFVTELSDICDKPSQISDIQVYKDGEIKIDKINTERAFEE